MRKYEYENNNLKILLKKSKDRQYSTDISKNNIFNSFMKSSYYILIYLFY